MGGCGSDFIVWHWAFAASWPHLTICCASVRYTVPHRDSAVVYALFSSAQPPRTIVTLERTTYRLPRVPECTDADAQLAEAPARLRALSSETPREAIDGTLKGRNEYGKEGAGREGEL